MDPTTGTVAAGTLDVAHGGDGATTAAQARVNLGITDANGKLSAFDGSQLTNIVASFSTGKEGADLQAAPTTTFGSDGDFVKLTNPGSNPLTITSFGTAANGKRMVVYIADNGITLSHGAGGTGPIILQGAGNFLTVVGDIFEFVSVGPNVWRELRRSVTNDSFLQVKLVSPAANSIPYTGALYQLPYDTVVADTQGEFSGLGGPSPFWQAKQNGLYQVTQSFATNSVTWTAGDNCQIWLSNSSSGITANLIGNYVINMMSTLSGNCSLLASSTFTFSAGQKVYPFVLVFRNQGGENQNVSPAPGTSNTNVFTVTRLR
jgi:hypothetical protein